VAAGAARRSRGSSGAALARLQVATAALYLQNGLISFQSRRSSCGSNGSSLLRPACQESECDSGLKLLFYFSSSCVARSEMADSRQILFGSSVRLVWVRVVERWLMYAWKFQNLFSLMEAIYVYDHAFLDCLAHGIAFLVCVVGFMQLGTVAE
jgi:hypothetical protein